MHPIDKKYKNLTFILLLVAMAIVTYNLIKNPYNFYGLCIIAIVTFANNMKIKHRLTLFTIFVIFILLVINLIEFGHASDLLYSNMELFNRFRTNFIYAAILLSLPLFFIYVYFMLLIKAMEHEKTYYETIKYSPHLVCEKHYSKTIELINHGFKSIRCRHDENCLRKNNIVHAKHIIGLVGFIKSEQISSDNYYIALWDNELGVVRDADYDVIEIHKSPSINDYNGIVNKITSFFYNELERYKPIDEVIIRIVGDITISKSTKRLLEERFLKIEYLSI